MGWSMMKLQRTCTRCEWREIESDPPLRSKAATKAVVRDRFSRIIRTTSCMYVCMCIRTYCHPIWKTSTPLISEQIRLIPFQIWIWSDELEQSVRISLQTNAYCKLFPFHGPASYKAYRLELRPPMLLSQAAGEDGWSILSISLTPPSGQPQLTYQNKANRPTAPVFCVLVSVPSPSPSLPFIAPHFATMQACEYELFPR